MKSQYRKREKTELQFSKSIINKNISLPITLVGKNIAEIIEKYLKENYEGKCIVEGYIKPGSSKIISYSSGVVSGDTVTFIITFQCEICYPVEGMLISCVAKNITKAGIRAVSAMEKDEDKSPFIVFIARDHHQMNEQFQSIQENTRFVAKVIGQRFELNDRYISIIAELTKQKTKTKINA